MKKILNKILFILAFVSLLAFIGINIEPTRISARNLYNSGSLDDFNNSNNGIYFAENFISQKVLSKDNNPYFIGSPIDLRIKPEELSHETDLNISIDVDSDVDWKYYLSCRSCKTSMESRPLYYRGLSNTSLAFQFDDINIYSRKDSETQKASASLKEWFKELEKNQTVNVLGNDIDLNEYINFPSDLEFLPATYKFNLRGSQKYLTLLQDTLDLKVLKTNLKRTPAKDEVKVRLYDVNSNLIYESMIPDSVETNQEYTVTLKLPQRSLYYLEFVGSDNDFIINEITVNSNKLTTVGNVLFSADTEVYTESNYDKVIQAQIWYKTAQRSMKFDKDVLISGDRLSVWQDIPIKSGSYYLNIKKDIYLNKLSFSTTPSSFFNPFIFNLDEVDTADYVIGKYKFEKNQQKVRVSISLPYSVWGDFKEETGLRIILNSPQLAQRQNRAERLYNINKYQLKSIDKNLEIYSTLNYVDKEQVDFVDPGKTIDNITQDQSQISLYSAYDIQDLYEINVQNLGYLENSTTKITPFLRGNHQFQGIFKSEIKLSFWNKTFPGSQIKDNELIVSIRDMEGVKICSSNFKFDEKSKQSFFCKVPDSIQIYNITFEINDNTKNFGYSLEELEINTNKFVAVSSLLSLGPTTLYVDDKANKAYQLQYWWESKHQDVELKYADSVSYYKLNQTNINVFNKIEAKGIQSIYLPKGFVVVRGDRLAFTTNGSFNYQKFETVHNTDENYLVVSNPFKITTNFSNLQVEFK